MRVSERVRGYGELRRSTGRGRESTPGSAGAPSGRHAFDEDAVLTPIFHALNRGGGWRGRQQEAAVRPTDEVDRFRRDPLTAPIPIQALSAAAVPSPAPPVRPSADHAMRRRRAAHALAEPRREDGRHHHRLETVGAAAGY
ncbi:MAG: hypothetical protein L0H64_24325 [Pseudonocardia sp.]|nr:hypothetical protein [Pseudonocardia sp.]